MWQRKSPRGRGRLFVDVTAVADGQDEDYNDIILNVGDEAIIADAITPLAVAVCSQALSVKAGIGAAFEIAANPSGYRGGHMAVKFL